MAIGKTVLTKIKEWGTVIKVYNESGVFIGNDKLILSPMKRSVEENISSFGRNGYFHNKTIVYPGCYIENTLDGKKFFISAWRDIGVKKETVTYSAFLSQINAYADVIRQSINTLNEDTGEASYVYNTIFSNIPIYIEKKDWTMELSTRYGRDQKGYETVLCQKKDIRQEDRLVLNNKQCIVQDVNLVLHENMLRLQVGADIK